MVNMDELKQLFLEKEFAKTEWIRLASMQYPENPEAQVLADIEAEKAHKLMLDTAYKYTLALREAANEQSA